MSDKKWTLLFEILAGNQGLVRAVGSSQSTIKRFVRQAQADFQSIGRAWSGTMGKVAGIGLGFGAGKILIDSAKLDHSLNQIAISAGKTRNEARAMKEELEGLGIKTGLKPEDLEQSFRSLVALTGSWDAAKNSISAVNTAVAVTGASTEELGQSLSVVADAFDLDLTKPKVAADLLGKMAAMGKGAGGLSHVAEMMNQISQNARQTGMGADSTLKFAGMIGQATKNPAQMSALAENVLRVFTNLRTIQHMRGVDIFDKVTHQRRDPLLILQEMQKQYEKLDDKGQNRFLMRLTGGDVRGARNLATLFSSGAVNSLDKLGVSLKDASNDFEKKLSEGLNDAQSQAKRLQNLLEHAADSFAEPVNKAVANLIQYAMDKQGLSGGQIAGLGTAAILSMWVGGRVAGRAGNALMSRFLGSKVGLAGGVAEGALLKQAGVTPVYVVNFSEMGGVGNALAGGKFQEYLPGFGGAAAGAGSGGIGAGAKGLGIAPLAYMKTLGLAGWSSIALPVTGMVLAGSLENKAYMKRRMAEIAWEKDKNREVPDSEKYNLFSDQAPAVSNKIGLNIFIDDKGRIISSSEGSDVSVNTKVKRGKFTTQAVADAMHAGVE
jgi:hypothetical protein